MKNNELRKQIEMVISRLENSILALEKFNDKYSKELIEVYQKDIGEYKSYLKTL